MIKKKSKQLDFEALSAAAECLRILAHPSRLQIIQLLLGNSQYSVNELAEACDLSQPATSDHLRLMQRCGFLTSERDGRTVYYQVSEPHLQQIMDCLQSRFAGK